MAITYVGSAGAAGTGAVTPDFPAGVTTGDFLLLRIEGEGEDGNADGPPTGGEWTAVGVGSVASATDGASDRTRLSVYWAPYDPDINRTVPDAGDQFFDRLGLVARGLEGGVEVEPAHGDILPL